MYVVVTLTVPTSYLVDTCAGGTWSLDENDAVWFASHGDAVAAVIAADVVPLSTMEIDWDVMPITVGG
jgi:hypothetical protein